MEDISLHILDIAENSIRANAKRAFFIERSPGREQPEDHSNRDAHAANARPTAHDFGIKCDARVFHDAQF